MARQYKGRQKETEVPAKALEGKVGTAMTLTNEFVAESIAKARNYLAATLPSGLYGSTPNPDIQGFIEY